MRDKSTSTVCRGTQPPVRYRLAFALLAQFLKNHAHAALAVTVLVLIAASLLAAPLALAKLALNTIDPVGLVSDHGRHIVATGPIACTAGERAYLRVTVTQRSTGAVAEGTTRVVCTGNSQQWEVHAATEGSETFAEGPATAVAIARTAERNDISDSHQWLVNITLVRE